MKKAVFLLFVSLCLPVLHVFSQGMERPNILFIISEDNGPELGCYGAPVETPNLDQLAKEGALFSRAFVPQAGCSQSRASFFTGLYPHQNGQIGLATWKYRMYNPHTPNIPETLKAAGYRTGIIGKLHVNPESAFSFDYVSSLLNTSNSNFSRKNMEHYALDAVEFIEECTQPFYLQVNYPEAHAPFLDQVNGVPSHPLSADDVDALPYTGLNNQKLKALTASYYNCIMRLDHYVGDLIRVLKENGKYKNTLIVYIGDHGADLVRGKRTSYEGGLRIPMIISWGDKIVHGSEWSELVSTIDLYPTFIEAAGLPVPDYLPGKSMLPLLKGEHISWREYLFTEYHTHSNHNPYPQRTVRGDRFKLICNPLTGTENPGFDFTLSHCLKMSENELLDGVDRQVVKAYGIMKNPPEYELYDLRKDPYEMRNLAGDRAYANILEQLKTELVNWQVSTSDPLIDPLKARQLFEVISTHGTMEKPRTEVPYREFMNPGLDFSENLGRPNVLLITIDDMNDWISLFDPDNPIQTPCIEKLAERGTFFSRAYCSSPACNPSRASVWTGTRPHKTGIYGNSSDWRNALPEVKPLQRYFKDNGYFVCGTGKVFHHHLDWAFHDNASFNEYLMMSINEPYPDQKLNGLEWYGSRNTDWGVWPDTIVLTADYRSAEYAIQKLEQKHDRPFFLNVGIYKPHSPFFAPKEFFDCYPDSLVELPRSYSEDMDDLPAGALQLVKSTGWFWDGMEKAVEEKPDAYRDYVRAYQACASFADEMIAKVLEALNDSPYKENTIVILWSDHGFHLGEKEHFEKFALWEKSTHIPFIIVAPGLTTPGSRIDKPVDMTAIYPTLSELCGLEIPDQVDGISLVPLLKDSCLEYPPALMTYMKGNHAIRSERWRYIQYADGTQELYDHQNDPDEWYNLANEEEYKEVIEELKQYIPDENAEQVPDLETP